MFIETPKLLGKMATGKYDFEDKDQLKKDMKTIYGSAIYYGGAVVTVMTAGAAAPLLTAKTTALSLGKSVASHAVIGSVSKSVDFWGFLNLEAAETVGGLAMGSEDFASTVGGYATSDLFNGLVGAVQSGLSTIASEDSESNDDEDKFMVEFLGTVNEAIGKAMQEMSDEEINALS